MITRRFELSSMKGRSLFQKRIAAFVNAGRGIATLMRTQVHPWIHLLATVVVLATAAILHLSTEQWCLLLLATGLVWSAEAMNTAVEFVVDLVSPEHHELAGRAKDVAAAGVLLAAIAAAVVGAIVFVPHLIKLF